MPSQRRPPPPPPPGDDGPVPPPLPNRGGAAPLPTLLSNGGSAPPPLPNRNQHGGSGPVPPALPARPAQQPPGESQRARSMASRSYPNGNHFQDEYLLPTSNGVNDEEEEELYEEMNPVPDIRPPTPLRPQGNQATAKTEVPNEAEPARTKGLHKMWNSFREVQNRPRTLLEEERKRKISVPANATVHEAIDDEPEQTYELPEESTLVRPRAGLPLPSSSRKNRNSDTPDDGDDDLWSDSEFDNVDDLNGNNSGSDNDGNNLYLTPDGGGCSNEMMEDTYESPDTGDAGVGHFTKTPVNKPVVAPRDAPGGLVQKLRSEFASFAEKKKMFNQPQSANTSDNSKRKPPGHPEKATPIFNPPTPPKPTVNSRPDQISKEGALPHSKRSSPEFSKPLPPPNKPSVPSKPPTTEKPLLPRPVANVSLQPQNSSSNSPSALPPALPPNHPSTRNHRNEDNSSAGSSSSESGGGVSGGFLAELTKVISSVPSSKHAERSQVTLEHPESVEGDIYDDGSSVPQHPLLCHPWFHEDATRKTGDLRVMQIKQEGAFLVRPSSKEDSYVLVVFSGGKTCNLPIALRRDGQYALGTEKPEEKRFESVAALIDHHLHCKITLSQGGHVILTKHARRQ